MSDFDHKSAVDLFSKQNSLISSLWGIYVVATFTAAAFSFNASSNSVIILASVTAGFWAFALGHLTLIRQALSINIELKQALLATPKSNENPFSNVVSKLAKTANTTLVSTLVHLFINSCVTVVIWHSWIDRMWH